MTKRIYNPKMIADRIKSRRAELGMTQKELAEKSERENLPLSLHTIKSYETGRRIPEDGCLESLARLLNVYPDWILGKTKYLNEEEELSALISSMSKKFSGDINVLKSFLTFSDSLGYKIDFEECTIMIGRKKKKVSPETINYLYWSVIKATKEILDNADKIDGTIPPLGHPYIEILKEGDALD